MAFPVNRGRKLKSLRQKSNNSFQAKPIWEHNWDLNRANAVLGSQPITAIIGAIGAGSIIASISYRVGYLFRIDPGLISFFSIQDIVSSSVAVVPIITMLGLLSFGLSMVTLKSTKSNVRDLSRGEGIRQSIFLGILILVSIVGLFLFDVGIAIMVLGALLSTLLAIYLGRQKRIISASVYFCVTLLFLALFPFSVFGSNRAQTDLQSDRRPHRITVGNTTSDVLILLANSEVLIVRDDPRIVRVVPRRLVTEIKILGVGKPLDHPMWSRLWQYFTLDSNLIDADGR